MLAFGNVHDSRMNGKDRSRRIVKINDDKSKSRMQACECE